MSNTIEARVKDLIIWHLGLGAHVISVNDSFADDLGADSLDQVELLMAIEEEFDLEIPEDKSDQFTYVKDVIDYVLLAIKKETILPPRESLSIDAIASKEHYFELLDSGLFWALMPSLAGVWDEDKHLFNLEKGEQVKVDNDEYEVALTVRVGDVETVTNFKTLALYKESINN